jgi:hypothetical protein
VVIPLEYTRVEFFGETGVILLNENGYFIADDLAHFVPIDCDDITVISDRAAIARKGHRFGVVNPYGDLLVPIGMDYIWNVSEELVGLRFVGKEGLMNTDGDILLMPVYDMVYHIAEDILAVSVGNTFGLMSTAGNVIFMLELSDTWVYSDELSVWLRFHNNRLDVAGEQGEIILDTINFIYDKAVNTPDTLYKAQKGSQFGYVDIDGSILLPLIYDSAWTFNEELSLWIAHDTNWMMTGRQGETILDPETFLHGSVYGSDLLHQVSKEGRFGYINANGEIVIPIEFDEINYYENGIAIARKGSQSGFIDQRGDLLTPIIYENITEFSEDMAWVKKDGKWGILRMDTLE